MQKQSSTYSNYLISNWFLAILLLFSIGDYTNYTQPIHHRETINLVISPKENAPKSTLYTDVSIDKQEAGYNNRSADYLQFLSKQHSTIFYTKNSISNRFIALFTHRLLIHRSNIYITEEDSFHIV